MLENMAWGLFSATGDIDGYLLYKDLENEKDSEEEPNEEQS